MKKINKPKTNPAKPSRIIVERIYPEIDGGQYPAKRTVGETVAVEASIFTDGHDSVKGVLLYKKCGEKKWSKEDMALLGNDRWQGKFTVEEMADYIFTVQGFLDHFGTWQKDIEKKWQAGQDVSVDLTVGIGWLEDAASRATDQKAKILTDTVKFITKEKDQDKAVNAAIDESLYDLVWENRNEEEAVRYSKELRIAVERPKANFSAWYELFPRSWGEEPGAHGTFKSCERLLPEIARMGFDVLYLPPIHPIGRKNRKGKNNVTKCEKGDVGCPWAIGAKEGGHKSIHPDLGTVKDFERFVKKAGEYHIEVALDLALQCSPDHPYVKEHPDWFKWRPDGTVQYAENPPKKYEDVLPINFETDDWENLWDELKSIVEFWVEKGVKIFRVDNPHTKPFVFWDWMIENVRKQHPEVIFLSEAFTRPSVMYRLGKGGFSQSYTYFTWRNTKQEFIEYMTELTRTEVAEIYRPNFWPNTPDILPQYLQYGGRQTFMMRLILAATLSSNYGIYGPVYELCVNGAVEGKEEYIDSEKYELRQWNWDQEGNLKDLIARVNKIRRENKALQQTRNIEFCHIDNDAILAFVKSNEALDDIILVVVNLDSHYTQSGWVQLPVEKLGIASDGSYMAHDLLTGDRYFWHGDSNYVELNPHVSPAHIFKIRRRVNREQDFDYFI